MDQYVIRTNRSGMWLGAVLEPERTGALSAGTGLTFRGRRAWSWEGALDASVLAVEGPKAGRIGPVVAAEVRQDDVIEVVGPMTPAALAALERVAVWSRS